MKQKYAVGREWINVVNIQGTNIQTQLMESCSEELRFALFQSDSAISTKPETEILAAIKRLSVKDKDSTDANLLMSDFVWRLDGCAERHAPVNFPPLKLS